MDRERDPFFPTVVHSASTNLHPSLFSFTTTSTSTSTSRGGAAGREASKISTDPVGIIVVLLLLVLVVLLPLLVSLSADGDVRDVLLPEDDQLDLVAGLLDDGHGVVHVARRLPVDGHDLVVLADAEARSLACNGKKKGGKSRSAI